MNRHEGKKRSITKIGVSRYLLNTPWKKYYINIVGESEFSVQSFDKYKFFFLGDKVSIQSTYTNKFKEIKNDKLSLMNNHGKYTVLNLKSFIYLVNLAFELEKIK